MLDKLGKFVEIFLKWEFSINSQMFSTFHHSKFSQTPKLLEDKKDNLVLISRLQETVGFFPQPEGVVVFIVIFKWTVVLME